MTRTTRRLTVTLLTTALCSLALAGGCKDDDKDKGSTQGGGNNAPASGEPQSTLGKARKYGEDVAGEIEERSAELAADAPEKAKELLAVVKQQIQDKRFDLADASLKQLDALSPQLSPDWSGRINQVKQLLANAKAAAGATGGDGIRLPGQ